MTEEISNNDAQPEVKKQTRKGLGRRDLLLRGTVLSAAATLATSASKQSAQAQTQNDTGTD
jgi:hypothetical protein